VLTFLSCGLVIYGLRPTPAASSAAGPA